MLQIRNAYMYVNLQIHIWPISGFDSVKYFEDIKISHQIMENMNNNLE